MKGSPLRVASDRHYGHHHTWVVDMPDGRVRVGIDGFAAAIIPASLGVIFPAVGTRLSRGGFGCWVADESGLIPIRMPLGGTLVRINERLRDYPAMALHDPYGEGWLMEIDGSFTAAERAQLLSPSQMRRRSNSCWRNFLVRLGDTLRPKGIAVGPTMADGGLLHPRLPEWVGVEAYRKLVMAML